MDLYNVKGSKQTQFSPGSCWTCDLLIVCFFTNRITLLLLWDVLVDVLVSPVEHQLLLLPVVHPHDFFGYFLNDLLEFSQLLGPTKWQLLAAQIESKLKHKLNNLPGNIHNSLFPYLQTVPLLIQNTEISFVSFLNLREENQTLYIMEHLRFITNCIRPSYCIGITLFIKPFLGY